MQTPSPEVAFPTTKTCPACGGARRHVFRFETNGCDILQCEECGLGRTETSRFDPAAYYTEDYFSGRHSDGYSDYLGAEPVLRREFAHSVDFIRNYHRDGKLLELGAASAFSSWKPRAISMWPGSSWPQTPRSMAAALD